MTVVGFLAEGESQRYTLLCSVCGCATDVVDGPALAWLSANSEEVVCEDCDLAQWQFLPPIQLLVKTGEFLHVQAHDKDPIKELVFVAGPSVGLGSEYCVPVAKGGL